MKNIVVFLFIIFSFKAFAKNECQPDDVLAQYYLYEACLNESAISKVPSYTGYKCHSFVNKSEIFANPSGNSLVHTSEVKNTFADKLPAGPHWQWDMSSISAGQYVEVKMKDGSAVVRLVAGFSYNSLPMQIVTSSQMSYAPNASPKNNSANSSNTFFFNTVVTL